MSRKRSSLKKQTFDLFYEICSKLHFPYSEDETACLNRLYAQLTLTPIPTVEECACALAYVYILNELQEQILLREITNLFHVDFSNVSRVCKLVHFGYPSLRRYLFYVNAKLELQFTEQQIAFLTRVGDYMLENTYHMHAHVVHFLLARRGREEILKRYFNTRACVFRKMEAFVEHTLKKNIYLI